MKFLTIILLTILSLLFIPPIQSTIPIPGLVEHVCRLTPHYHLCIMTLKSTAFAHRLASNADVAGFARITLEVIASKAPVILETLHEAYAQADTPEVKIALSTCITSYTKISKEIVPQALGCVDKGDYNGVKQNAYVAGNLASSCDKKCNSTGGGSKAALPLGDTNQYVQNMCAITVSIVTKLAQANHQGQTVR